MAGFVQNIRLGFRRSGCAASLLQQPFRQQTFEQSTVAGVPEQSTCPFKLTSALATVPRLKGFGVSMDDIFNDPIAMNLSISDIENRLQYCAEGGLNTSIGTVSGFHDIVSSPLPLLRSADILSHDIDVIENMLARIQFDGPYPSHIELNQSYERIHFLTVCHCLQHSYDFSLPFWKRYFHTSLWRCFKSIETLDKIGCTMKWIQDHASSVCMSNPHNLQKIYEMQKMLELPLPLSLLLRRDPDIAFIDSGKLKAIFFILMENKVCRHELLKLKKSDHFFAEPDYLSQILRRVNGEQNGPVSSPLSLVYKRKLIQLSEKKTHELSEIPTANLKEHVNSCRTESIPVKGSWQHGFQLWVQSGSSLLECKPCQHDPYLVSDKVTRYPPKREVKIHTYLASSLGVSEADVKDQLSLIPLGLTATMSRAHSTLQFLLDRGYSKEEIRKNMQLLIYPRRVVEEKLDLVLKDPQYGNADYRHRHLQLCMYHVLLKFSYSPHPL